MARQRMSTFWGQGRPRIRAWTSCRNRLRVAPLGEHRNRNRFLHRMSGKQRILVDQNSCLRDDGPAREQSRPVPYQWCSDLERLLSATCVRRLLTVVGGIFLSGNHSLGVEETSVGTGSDLVNDIGLKIDLGSEMTSQRSIRTHVERSRNVLAGTSLGEES